jgi:pimeloyl-ACP methyl ester carboxylesterase
VDRSTTPYVHESGRPGSPAIVFLRRVGASGRMWEEHMRRLTAYHCLAPDLPGHGRSNRVPWRSLADTSEQVARLIETRFPSRRAHVVGLSLGGAVAHTLLARRPELLDRVVIDGCGALPAWWVGLTKLAVAGAAPGNGAGVDRWAAASRRTRHRDHSVVARGGGSSAGSARVRARKPCTTRMTLRNPLEVTTCSDGS